MRHWILNQSRSLTPLHHQSLTRRRSRRSIQVNWAVYTYVILGSLPIYTGSITSSFTVQPPLTTTVTSPITSPEPLAHPTSATSPIFTPPLSRPGMILSPASDPIPYSLVQRIQSGQFVEMRDLMADNISLINQLSSLGNTQGSMFQWNRTRLREVSSLASWLYCFNAYIAVRTSDPLARNMLAYSRLIIREALRHGNSGWLEYDRVFRRQISINPALAWNTLDPSLQASTIVGLGQSGGGTFCTICRECDHSATSCALAPLQQQLHPRYPVRDNRNDRPPKRLETLQRICISWNRGSCRKVGCSFRHICATCQLNHRAKDCPDTPATSEYKSGIRQHTGKT